MNDSLQVPFVKKTYDELSATDRALVNEAEEALTRAHAPYSHFRVGSALRLNTGKIVTGNNQENAAYPSGLCAERVALFKTRSEYSTPIEALVVLAENSAGKQADAFPCGACRQVMMEYASMQDEPIRILMRDHEGTFIMVADVRMLLPFSFDTHALGSRDGL